MLRHNYNPISQVVPVLVGGAIALRVGPLGMAARRGGGGLAGQLAALLALGPGVGPAVGRLCAAAGMLSCGGGGGTGLLLRAAGRQAGAHSCRTLSA